MKTIMILLSLLSNLLSLYVNIRVIRLFLHAKQTPIITKKYLIYGIVWLSNWLCHFFFTNSILTPLSMLAGLFISSIILFDGTLFKKITSVMGSFVIMTLIEQFIWLFLPFHDFFSKNETYGSLLTSLISLIAILALEYLFKFNKDIQLPKSSYITIIIQFIGSVILCEIISILGKDNPFIATCGFLFVCIINLCTLYQYGIIIITYQKSSEQKYMEQRISMYENQFDIISEAQTNLRSMRHDFKNHLLLLGGYIQKKDYESALSYINNIDTRLNITKEFVRTGNNEIDSILNYLLNQAAQLGCTITTKIEVPLERFMPSFDLNILLSNLLENAIEAMEKTSKRILDVYIKYEKNILYINIQNSFDGYIKQQRKSFLTLKPDKNKHGFGLNNIQAIVNKYQGQSSFVPNGDIFRVDIILYLPSLNELSA